MDEYKISVDQGGESGSIATELLCTKRVLLSDITFIFLYSIQEF